MPATWFVIGLATGIAVTIPLAIWSSRRTARRMRGLADRARSAERLAQLGTLTGGLAHEIRNPLSTLGLNLQLLAESIEDAKLDEPHGGRIQRRIKALTEETDRLRNILEDFLRFAGRMKLDRHPVAINELIEQLVDFYAPQAQASGVQLRADLDPRAGSLDLDAALLKQALLNLLINATQAMVAARYADQPHGGSTELILRTEAGRDHITLHVTDTGPGIPPDNLEKIFQPYFSTKKDGTGLGLATTRRIVEEHGGTITVHSEPARGSDFTITLPTQAET
jgi:signal transduction histidine kinase